MNKEMKKGKIVLITGSDKKRIDKANAESKQIKEIYQWSINNDLVPPPYDPKGFLVFYERNATFFATVNQIARDVAGLGWDIILKDGAKENKSEKEKINEFLQNSVPENSLRTLFNEILIDWGTIGYFGIEVIRNLKGEVAQLKRIPAYTIRVHKSKKKFCQVKYTNKVWFKQFGLEEDISYKTGKVTSNNEEKANEIIFYKNSCQTNDFYGVPNILAALGDVNGLVESSTYNQAFFENFGVPASIIRLSGEWEEGSEEIVKKFLSTEVKGSQNGFKSLVLRQSKDCELEFDDLSPKQKDSSFANYQKECKENVLAVYSMPPERVGISVTGPLGGEKVREANRIYKQAIVEPLQCDLEDIMQKILSALDVSNYSFKFKDLDLTDPEEENKKAESISKLISQGVLSINEARKKLGLSSVEGGDVLRISGITEDIGVVSNDAN